MSYKKHFLSIALSAALVTSCFTTAFATESTFTDVDPQNSEAIVYMTENKFISGIDETKFGVDMPVSRAEAVAVLHRMSGLAEAVSEVSFSDVTEGSDYAKAVEWASANGIVSGYSDGTFAPDETITKQDLVSLQLS